MKTIDLLSMSLKNLFRRKIRTLLTLLGVLIGTTSITVMMSIGVGMDESFKLQLSRMGSLNVITVDPYYIQMEGNGGMWGSATENTIDDKAIAEMSAIPGVEAVSPEMRVYLKFAAGRKIAHVDLVGIDPEKMELFDFKLKEGRLLTPEDKGGIVFGSWIPKTFMDPREMSRGGFFVYGMDGEDQVDLLNEKLIMTFDMSYGERRPMYDSSENRPKYKTYKVDGVGILSESGEKDYSAYININYLKEIIKDNERVERSAGYSSGGRQGSRKGYDRALVKVKDINNVEAIQKKINEMGYGAYSLADIRKEMQKSLAIVQAVLGAIGAISLLVAALGITNTMYMSIYERTKEIGIIKVLGCYLKDVRKIFLTEAGMIGFLGGVTGILLSYGISFVINIISSGFMNSMGGPMDQNAKAPGLSIIPIWLALFAVLFAVLVGLVAGYLPSRRAMRLSALEAIKSE